MSYISRVTTYSLDILLSLFGTSLLFYVQFSLLFLDLHADFSGQVVWYSNLFQNFPQVVIHTVESFGIVNKAEVDFFFFFFFLELSCFFNVPVDVGNLISGSSDFSKSSLNILLKPGLENFEHYFASI